MTRLFSAGFLYDISIGSALRKTRLKIAEIIFEKNLYPVIDICCGTGQQCGLMDTRGFITGIDNDLEFVDYARRRHPSLPFVCADAGSLPFGPNLFRCAVISYSLHEKPAALQKKMMEELRRVCLPQSVLIFLDFENPWNKKSRLGAALTYLIERSAGGEHFRLNRDFLKRGGLRAFIRRFNLEVLKTIPLELGCSSVTVARI